MSRTITKLHHEKISLAASEADLQGKTELAEYLTRQIEKTAVRQNTEGYTYTHSDFEKDIKDKFWEIVVRAEDYHGAVIDPSKVEEIIEAYSKEFVKELRKVAGFKPVGKYEPKVLGEIEED
jgi:hypothetical protein